MPVLASRHRAVRLHRFVMGAPPRMMVDHQFGNTFDNRKQRLRVCNNPQNQANSGSRGGTSRFKGVSWNARKRRWLVAFRANGRYHFVVSFADEEEAARAFDAASKRASGEFARLNFPDLRAA
jgi:AP2 domain